MCRVFAGKQRMCKKAEYTETVRYGHDNDTVSCKPFTVKLHFGCITPLKSTSVYPYKNRQLLIRAVCTCPDVQIKTVFTDRYIRIHVKFTAVQIVSDSGTVLHRYRTELIALPRARPVTAGLWCTPPVLTRRRCRKGDTPEDRHSRIVRRKPFYCSVFRYSCSDHFLYTPKYCNLLAPVSRHG